MCRRHSSCQASEAFKNIEQLCKFPRQLGGWADGKTCPYRHVAVFPPRLVYPPGQLSVRFVPCTTGSAGTVTTLLHVESWVVHSGS